jgi:hypothetical protein
LPISRYEHQKENYNAINIIFTPYPFMEVVEREEKDNHQEENENKKGKADSHWVSSVEVLHVQ